MTNTRYLPLEARYGMPPADIILHNRQYTVGYSNWIKQPKWVLEVIDDDNQVDNAERKNNFRPDHRIPEVFRVKKEHYVNSGYDKGHLIASANRLESRITNSETFLMSNMSPQLPSMNQGVWKKLEDYVRELAEEPNVLETYCISGPVWAFGKSIESLKNGVEDGIIIPIPHLFFKCILTEAHTGTFRFYAFLIPNEDNLGPLTDYYVTTTEVERYTGLHIWDRISGSSIDRKKDKKYKLWFDER